MKAPIKEKFGIFKELVSLVDTKFRATFTTLIVLGLAYSIWKNDRDKDKLYGIIIQEVRKQVPVEVNKQVAPIKQATDSTNSKVGTSLSKVDSAATLIKEYITKKIK